MYASITTPGLEDIAAEELHKIGAHISRILKGVVIHDSPEDPSKFSRKARGIYGMYELVLDTTEPDDLKAELGDKGVQIALNYSNFSYVDLRKVVGNPVKKSKPGDYIIYGTGNTLLLLKNIGIENLDRRAYLIFRHPAALNPVIAHLMLLFSGWNGEELVDPFCGSGTILIEAAMLRRARLTGIDKNPEFVRGAMKNIAAAGVKVTCTIGRAEELHRFSDAEFIITNPPYGFRTGGRKDTYALYENFARELEEHFSGAEMTIITPLNKFEHYFHVLEKREIRHGKLKNKILRVKI